MIDCALWWDEIASIEEKDDIVLSMLRKHRKLRVYRNDVDNYEMLYRRWRYIFKKEKKKLEPFILEKIRAQIKQAKKKSDPTTPRIRQVA